MMNPVARAAHERLMLLSFGVPNFREFAAFGERVSQFTYTRTAQR
jgi:hypothetical protein